MLDGIMGRGFSAKCKSLMKTTRARIEVVRRRAEAKQRFLNEDLAKLLSNGLDINAYGRTEEFLAGMNLLWSYDFVEQSCEYIVKQLSRMQKQGECPEECREAVASLMYAAARFSDLPELRELRDVFQQRYGNCLEAFVNQKLVEKLSSRPPPKEKRLQVLQDIASEFSIKWDSRGFERRMATPSLVAQVDEQKVDIVKQRPGLLDEKKRLQSYAEGNIWERGDGEHHIFRKKETTIEYREKSLLKSGGSCLRGNVLTESKHSYPIEKADAELNDVRSNISSHGKILDNNLHIGYARHGNGIRTPSKGEREEQNDVRSNISSHGKILDNNLHIGYMRHSNGIRTPSKGESEERLFCEKDNVAPSCAENLGKTETAISSYNSSNIASNFIKKGVDKDSDRLKSCSGSALPPPYVKSNHSISRPPYVKLKEGKQKLSRDSKHAVPALDQHFTDPRPGGPHNKPDHHDCEEQFVAPVELKSHGNEKELDYQNEKIPLSKPRSIRRKHHKSPSSHKAVDALEDVGAVVNRSSSSRRKDHSRKGLQILFDEEHHIKDDEERMIDKLLIHYSKKPSSYAAGKLRKKLTGQPSHQIIAEGESSLDQTRIVHEGHPTRSVSLPHDQSASPESIKVFARSNTFQLDNQARHVHPKLPNYDDLAARFAALKGR